MSDSEEEALLLMTVLQTRRKRNCRRFWVHPIISKRKRYGEYNLLHELSMDCDWFLRYFRMTREHFDDLLAIVEPRVQRQTTNYRESINHKHRLMICLRFLSTGDTYTTIGFSFRIGVSTVGCIVIDTCTAL